MRRSLFLLLMPVCLALASCGAPEPADPVAVADAVERPVVATMADSVAMRAYEAAGGPEAWASMPYLAFDFGVERDGAATIRNEHLWNRRTGDYRIEWTAGADSNYVVLFNTDTRSGNAYLNGELVEGEAGGAAVERAYRSYINDTYWLMAPVKMFDPGVTRTYAADSSTATHDVVQLAFDGVGLTPGDQYWMYVDKETGMVDAWRFRLQSGNDGYFQWSDYETHETPAGPVRLAARKPAGDGGFALLTTNIETPQEVDPAVFTDPATAMR